MSKSREAWMAMLVMMIIAVLSVLIGIFVMPKVRPWFTDDTLRAPVSRMLYPPTRTVRLSSGNSMTIWQDPDFQVMCYIFQYPTSSSTMSCLPESTIEIRQNPLMGVDR